MTRLIPHCLCKCACVLCNCWTIVNRIPSPFNVVPEQVEHYAEQIQCPLLVVKASDSPWYMAEEYAEKILKLYKNYNPNFVYKTVEGGHHVHLNNPEKVAPLIVKFLQKTFSDSGTEEKEPTHLW